MHKSVLVEKVALQEQQENALGYLPVGSVKHPPGPTGTTGPGN